MPERSLPSWHERFLTKKMRKMLCYAMTRKMKKKKKKKMDLRDEETTLEPSEIFEENWFFSNLLDRKSRMMSRCFSDPCPSLKHEMFVEKSYDETYSSIKKNLENNDEFKFNHSGLIKAPSMPTPSSRKVLLSSSSSRKVGKEGCKSNVSSQCNDVRGYENGEDEDDEESEYSMGKLIRQASLGRQDILPPRRTSSKITIPTAIPRYRPMRKTEQETIKTEGSSEARRRQPVLNRANTAKNFADLESEELKAFKELGIKFDKKELNSKIVNNITPRLQEKKKNVGDGNKVKKPSNIPEARRLSAPAVINNGGKKSAEDMKAQIKFWARAVASNVRQEC